MTDGDSFDVDLAALLRVFGGHMYSTPAVFVRELVQNALDAIALRRAAGAEFEASVRIEVDEAGRTLRFLDNGIGLDRDGLREHLSRVGGTSKRAPTDATVIGQFGIGLLSGFLVAEELIVDTRLEGGAPLRWIASANGEYRIEPGEREAVGTEVTVRLDADSQRFADASTIRALLEKYVPFVDPSPTLAHGDDVTRFGTQPPWASGSDDDLAGSLETAMGEPPLAVLRFDEADTVGGLTRHARPSSGR